MHQRTTLSPLDPPRPSPRMSQRANLSANHEHRSVPGRPAEAVDFREFDVERLNLARDLLDMQVRAVSTRAILACIITLGNVLFGGLITWLLVQTSKVFQQPSLMPLIIFVFALAGLAVMFLSIVFALRAVTYWWNQGTPGSSAQPIEFFFGATQAGPGAAIIQDAAEFLEVFQRASRNEMLKGAIQALRLGMLRAQAQEATLRYSIVFFLLSVGALLLLVLLIGIALI